MFFTIIFLAIVGASKVIAQPVDLRKEAATVDVRTVGKRSVSPLSLPSSGQESKEERRWIDPPSTVPTHFGTECSLETCDMCPTFPGCEINHKASKDEKRWTDPPSTVPTHFGTECSLETCDMCPTYPGCEMTPEASKLPALQHWAQPPTMEKREEIVGKPIGSKGDWQQPRTTPEVKREAYIDPVIGGSVTVGVGPECSIRTCELCPDFPGCENQQTDMPPMA